MTMGKMIFIPQGNNFKGGVTIVLKISGSIIEVPGDYTLMREFNGVNFLEEGWLIFKNDENWIAVEMDQIAHTEWDSVK